MTLDWTVRFTVILVGIGVIVNTAELLAIRKPLSGKQLLTLRQALASSQRRWPLSATTVSVSVIVRGAAAVSAIMGAATGADLTIPIGLMAVTSLHLGWVKALGADGADQMTLLVVVALGIATSVAGTSDALKFAVVFIAAEAVLAYITAGIAKLFSQEWRRGVAVARVIDTVSYGDSRFAAYLRHRPHIARTLAWGTIAFEIAMPLVFVVPDSGAVALLAAAFGFHLACAVVMGLNDFVWAFSSTFPAIWFTSQLLRT